MNIFQFKNEDSVTIGASNPNTINSDLIVSGVEGTTKIVRVKLNIDHTYTSDLSISLISPTGERVSLVTNAGASGDNFRETLFSDDATLNISNSQAPFTGTFKPNEQLSLFNDKDANGQWTLEVADQAFQDGGVLMEWGLTIETDADNRLPLIFNNMTAVPINPGPPNVISSDIFISGQDGMTVNELAVTIDITHSYTNDLQVSLEHEDGTKINLVSFTGGSGDNFEMTNFDDAAVVSIQSAGPPFSGNFKPREPLTTFKDRPINGRWTLTIIDNANQDGGSLNFWKLCVFAKGTPVAPSSPFAIEVRFVGGLTPSQQSIFEQAAQRWSEAIVGDVPPFQVDGEVIDDLLILAEGKIIDGVNNILGQAGPTHVRPDSRIPIKGIMSFDSADLQGLEDSGELLDVIIHEMGHVLGIGTIWSELNLIEGSGTNNPVFVGPASMIEYGSLVGFNIPTKVPVANTGGPGTREGHWRELTFDSELMTGFDDPGRNAMSRVTIASLQDLGYQVNLDAADIYTLPLRSLSTGEVEAKQEHQCRIEFPEIQVISNGDRVV